MHHYRVHCLPSVLPILFGSNESGDLFAEELLQRSYSDPSLRHDAISDATLVSMATESGKKLGKLFFFFLTLELPLFSIVFMTTYTGSCRYDDEVLKLSVTFFSEREKSIRNIYFFTLISCTSPLGWFKFYLCLSLCLINCIKHGLSFIFFHMAVIISKVSPEAYLLLVLYTALLILIKMTF